MPEAFEKPIDSRRATAEDLLVDGYIIVGCIYYLKTERFGYINLRTHKLMNLNNFLSQIKEGRIFV